MEAKRLVELWQQVYVKTTRTLGTGLCFTSPVLKTAAGTPYLRQSGVALVARTVSNLGDAADFIDGMGFGDGYLQDHSHNRLTDGVALAKFAGQLCYLSLGEQRTKNADAQKYITRILQQGHGSVLEHVHYSLLLYGVSRATTHELVRHRHHSPSQVSQRYVAGRHLRFVETPESASNEELHVEFERSIDEAAAAYARREAIILRRRGIDTISATTAQRKAVRQEARRGLPNETEAPILLTGNVRAWRGLIDQRSSAGADAEICRLAWRCFVMLNNVEPMFWADYEERVRDEDGLPYVETPYKKV